MRGVLLDTHAWAWLLTNDSRLSQIARNAATSADNVWVSAISFYEITQRYRLGKWPEIWPYSETLGLNLEDQGGELAVVTGKIARFAGSLQWGHRDPFDRIIAATAFELSIPLVSADKAFDELKDETPYWPGRLW